MPLFELVLDFEGESAEEVRLTDRPVAVGHTVQIDNEDWTVVRELARTQRHRARFQCERARQMSERRREMLAHAEDLRRRAAEQHARLAQRPKSSQEPED